MKFVYSFLLSALISLNAFSQVPSIVSFTPNNGYVGTQVELTGSGFSSDISKNVVWIGGVKCPVISANPSSLVIEIPLHASRDCFLYTNTETNQSCYSKEKFIVRFNSSKGYNYTSGSFGEAVNFTLGAIGSPFNAKKFNLSDIDEDGKLDIVAFNDYSTVTFFLNNATPGTINSSTFVSSSQTVLTTDQYFRHTVISDWDSDGKLDYMAGLPGYAGSSLYKNTSTVGSPSLVHSYNTPTSYTFMPAPFDANRDGKIDIICLYDVQDRVY
ncbi:MAG TPA: FG-GAP-like repeat-containing protein, partial [Parasegetibacter sp.]